MHGPVEGGRSVTLVRIDVDALLEQSTDCVGIACLDRIDQSQVDSCRLQDRHGDDEYRSP
jgi:hypothetical protein